LDVVAAEVGDGTVEVFDFNADGEQPFAALPELFVEAAFFIDGLDELQECVADRQAGDLEAGAEGMIQRGVRLEAEVALPDAYGVVEVLGGDDYVVELLHFQGSGTSIQWLKRRIILAKKRVESGC